jgi:hypothetical protein
MLTADQIKQAQREDVLIEIEARIQLPPIWRKLSAARVRDVAAKTGSR